MTDTYRNFRELASKEREGEDWAREYVDRGSRVLVLAPHGGWIEPFTAELARAVAGNDLSFYAFQGLKDRGNPRLHLTSHRFDEPLALRAASSASFVLAIHGERNRRESFVMVGGLWEGFRRRIKTELREMGFRVERPRDGLGGVNPDNICNRGLSGIGGQLEISEALRETLRDEENELHRFIHAVRRALRGAAADSDSQSNAAERPQTAAADSDSQSNAAGRPQTEADSARLARSDQETELGR